MKKTAYVVCLVLFFAVTLLAGTLTLKLSVETVAQKALSLSPLLRKKILDIQSAKLTLKSIENRRYFSRLNLNLRGGVLTPDTGSDASLNGSDKWGGFMQAELSFAIPIYTFGKISKGEDAAQHGVLLAEAKRELEIQKILLRAYNAYWGLSAAIRLESMAFNLRKDYKKLLKEVRIESKKEKSDTDALDLLKVKSNQYQISKVVQDSIANRKIIEKSLQILLGGNAVSIKTSDEDLPELQISTNKASHLVLFAQAKRLEYKAIRAGIKALDAQISLARRNRTPDIYLGGGATYKWASNRPSSDSDYNTRGLGVFLGVTWRLDFWNKNIKIDKEVVRRKKLAQDLKLLNAKVSIEVQKAFTEVCRNYKLLAKAKKSFKSAKTWFRLAGDNWEMGLGSVAPVISSRNTYYTIKGAKIKCEYMLNLSLVKLAYVMGDITLYERWVKNGKVTL